MSEQSILELQACNEAMYGASGHVKETIDSLSDEYSELVDELNDAIIALEQSAVIVNYLIRYLHWELKHK